MSEAGKTEVLDAGECLTLLAQNPTMVGRIAVADARPVILPINYVVDGDSIVFRTGAGVLAGFVRRQTAAAFEADELDAVQRTGWSVLLRGWLGEVTAAADLEALRERWPSPWAAGAKPIVARLSAEVVSGRRIPSSDPQAEFPPQPPSA